VPLSHANNPPEDALAALEFAKHGIRERNLVPLADDGKHCKLFGVANGKIAKKESVDEGEDGGVGADAEGEREREWRRR